MKRRAFLSSLLAGAGALALDPERALWVPGRKLISIPAAKSPGDEFASARFVQAFGAAAPLLTVQQIAPYFDEWLKFPARAEFPKLGDTFYIARPAPFAPLATGVPIQLIQRYDYYTRVR